MSEPTTLLGKAMFERQLSLHVSELAIKDALRFGPQDWMTVHAMLNAWSHRHLAYEMFQTADIAREALEELWAERAAAEVAG